MRYLFRRFQLPQLQKWSKNSEGIGNCPDNPWTQLRSDQLAVISIKTNSRFTDSKHAVHIRKKSHVWPPDSHISQNLCVDLTVFASGISPRHRAACVHTQTCAHMWIIRPSLSLSPLLQHMSAYGSLRRETVEQTDQGLILPWRCWPGMEGRKEEKQERKSGMKHQERSPSKQLSAWTLSSCWPAWCCGLGCSCQTLAPSTTRTHACARDETYEHIEPSVPR